MQSPDSFLVMALVTVKAIRLERVLVRASNIAKWRNGITVFCLSAVCIFGLLTHMPSQEARALLFSAFYFPMTFGLLIGIAVMKHARNSQSEEHGVFASLILEHVADMSPSYAATFSELLAAIIDEDGPRAVMLADEISPDDPHLKKFTKLVHEAFG